MRAAIALLFCASPALAGPAGQRIQEALVRGEGSALQVQWEIGRPEAERRRLLVEGGKARLQSCPAAAACSDVGAAALSPGQRDRLISGLRAVGLGALRSAGDGDSPPDRALTVTLSGGPPASFKLARSEWPAPPAGDSEGVAAFLDELAGKLGRDAVARRPLPVPHSAAELAAVRLKLTVRPKEKPGGTLVLERGVARVTPAEGTVPRTPAPAPFERKLSEAEQEKLAQALAAAELEQLEEAVPRRAAAAIGDSDGRLVTLHLSPPLEGDKEPAYQPRGWERFLADLQRSKAAPLLQELMALLTAPAPRPARK